MQGRDQTNVRSSVITFNLGVTMLPVQEDDGPPLACPKAPVDSFGFGFYVGEEIVIALNMCSAWGTNLHEGKFLSIDGVLLQHSLNSKETLQNSLGVVHAIYANSKEQGFHARLL